MQKNMFLIIENKKYSNLNKFPVFDVSAIIQRSQPI